MFSSWQERIVSFAYRYQQRAKPYKDLINDFSSLFTLKGSENILDIGCGSGRLINLACGKARVNVIGLDNSFYALRYSQKIIDKPKVAFLQADISSGLPFKEESFDVIMAGLSLQYAEHWDGKQWTRFAYIKIFEEIFRCLKPSGILIFSVNTPHPDFSKIARESKREIFFTWKFPMILFASLIMVRQSKWLVEQADIGRFHYLPIEDIIPILKKIGYKNINYKKTYAGLALAIACSKPEYS